MLNTEPTTALLVALGLTMLTSCDAEMVCTPGVTEVCACPGSEVGAQACNEQGTGYEECICAPAGGEGGSGGGGQGGATPCDVAAEIVRARLEQCNIELPDGAGGGGGAMEQECTPAIAADATCVAGCVQSASCAALDGTGDSGSYIDCILAC